MGLMDTNNVAKWLDDMVSKGQMYGTGLAVDLIQQLYQMNDGVKLDIPLGNPRDYLNFKYPEWTEEPDTTLVIPFDVVIIAPNNPTWTPNNPFGHTGIVRDVNPVAQTFHMVSQNVSHSNTTYIPSDGSGSQMTLNPEGHFTYHFSDIARLIRPDYLYAPPLYRGQHNWQGQISPSDAINWTKTNIQSLISTTPWLKINNIPLSEYAQGDTGTDPDTKDLYGLISKLNPNLTPCEAQAMARMIDQLLRQSLHDKYIGQGKFK